MTLGLNFSLNSVLFMFNSNIPFVYLLQLALQEMSTSRYKEEFCEECVVGSGEFGTVFKCVNKLDGCTYAIKRSREPVAGSAFE